MKATCVGSRVHQASVGSLMHRPGLGERPASHRGTVPQPFLQRAPLRKRCKRCTWHTFILQGTSAMLLIHIVENSMRGWGQNWFNWKKKTPCMQKVRSQVSLALLKHALFIKIIWDSMFSKSLKKKKKKCILLL